MDIENGNTDSAAAPNGPRLDGIGLTMLADDISISGVTPLARDLLWPIIQRFRMDPAAILTLDERQALNALPDHSQDAYAAYLLYSCSRYRERQCNDQYLGTVGDDISIQSSLSAAVCEYHSRQMRRDQ